jgi:hypothetical protein
VIDHAEHVHVKRLTLRIEAESGHAKQECNSQPLRTAKVRLKLKKKLTRLSMWFFYGSYI